MSPSCWHTGAGSDSTGIAPRGAWPPPEAMKVLSGPPRHFKSALVLCITFALLSWAAIWHALAPHLGAQPFSEGLSHPALGSGVVR